MRRPAPLVLALVIVLAMALLAPAAGLVPAAQTLAADTDLTLVTDAAYEVRPDSHLVRVTVKISAKNRKAETKTTRYFFEGAYLAVPPGSSGYTIAGAKGARVRAAKSTPTYTLLRIDFGSRLYGGGSAAFTLGFDLRDSSDAAARQVRIGGSLASFPVWAFASDGATGSTVSVTFPSGYVVSVESGAFDRIERTPEGGTRLLTNALAKPLAFFAYVVGEREATYVDTPLTVQAGDREIPLTMRAWDDDPAWAGRVGIVFLKGLPVLAEEIGLPWPHADSTIVQEAASRTTGGYAGLYDPAESRIEVAYWADSLVVLHEAAHGWFNGTLLADRWANEGFASLYAERAAAALGETGTAPELTEAVKAARIPLNAWPQQAADGEDAAETYGYAASLVLARAIAERAGDAALTRVWADAVAGVGGYQPADLVPGPDGRPSPEAESGSGPPDWRGLLDLLEDRTGKDLTDLWRTWVVRPGESALLDARGQARTGYARTLALANGWTLPRPIRDALRAWQYEAAERLMSDARTVLAQRTAVEARAARNGLAAPPTMRRLFEGGSLADASREAEAELNAMLTIEGAAAARQADPDVLVRLGMLGAEPEADLARARAAFEAGDLDTTLSAADAAFTAWNGAWQEGRRRALLAIAALATVLVVASAIFGSIRRGRRTRGAQPA